MNFHLFLIFPLLSSTQADFPQEYGRQVFRGRNNLPVIPPNPPNPEDILGPDVTDQEREICALTRFREIGGEYSHSSPGYKDWISRDKLTWPASLECCILHDSDLLPVVTPLTSRKYLKIPQEGAWINSNDAFKNGQFTWSGGELVRMMLWNDEENEERSLLDRAAQKSKHCAIIEAHPPKNVTLSSQSCDAELHFICRRKDKPPEFNLKRNMTKWEHQMCVKTSFIKLRKENVFISRSKLPWVASHRCCEFWNLNLLPKFDSNKSHEYAEHFEYAWIENQEDHKDVNNVTNDTSNWSISMEDLPANDNQTNHKWHPVEKCSSLWHLNGRIELRTYNCKVSFRFMCEGESLTVKVDAFTNTTKPPIQHKKQTTVESTLESTTMGLPPRKMKFTTTQTHVRGGVAYVDAFPTTKPPIQYKKQTMESTTMGLPQHRMKFVTTPRRIISMYRHKDPKKYAFSYRDNTTTAKTTKKPKTTPIVQKARFVGVRVASSEETTTISYENHIQQISTTTLKPRHSTPIFVEPRIVYSNSLHDSSEEFLAENGDPKPKKLGRSFDLKEIRNRSMDQEKLANEIADIRICKNTKFTTIWEKYFLSDNELPWEAAKNCCEWFQMHLLYDFDLDKLNLSTDVPSESLWMYDLIWDISTTDGIYKFNVISQNETRCEKINFHKRHRSKSNCQMKHRFICQDLKICYPKEYEISSKWNDDSEMTEVTREKITVYRHELYYLTFQTPGPKLPEFFQPFKYLKFARLIFTDYCPEKFVPPNVINSVTRIFRYLLALHYDKHLSGWTKSKDMDQHQRILSSLEKCHTNSQRFEFQAEFLKEKCQDICTLNEQLEESYSNITIYCNCVQNIVQVNVNDSFIIQDVKKRREKYHLNFDARRMDFILEFIWKMILFMHYACTKYFEDFGDISFMYNELEDLFDSSLKKIWKNPGHDGNEIWATLFPEQSLELIGEGVDACVMAAISSSDYPRILTHPLELDSLL